MRKYIYLGIIEEIQNDGLIAKIEQRNKFCVGDEIEIMKPDGRNVPVKVISLTTEEGEKVESAPHPQQVLFVELSEKADRYDLLRVKK